MPFSSMFYKCKAFSWALGQFRVLQNHLEHNFLSFWQFLCYFSLSSTVVGGKKPLEIKPKISVNPDSRLQNAKWRERNGNTDFFQSHITIHPYNNASISMCPSFQRLAWASRSSLSRWLHIVICPSIHLLFPLWIWWHLGCAAKSRCSIWLGNPQRTNYWCTAEGHVDILHWKW